MATSSITTHSLSLELSLARYSRTSAPDREPAPDRKPEAEGVYSVADDTAVLIDKLESALDVIRDDKRGNRRDGPRVGYDDRGRLPGEGRRGADEPRTGGYEAAVASIQNTEITIANDGIRFRQASLNVGRLETGAVSASVVSFKVTEAYMSFGRPDRAAAPIGAVA